MGEDVSVWKTLVAYPLVVATGLAIGSGELTVPTFLTGATLGLLCAVVFEFVMWVIKRARSGPTR